MDGQTCTVGSRPSRQPFGGGGGRTVVRSTERKLTLQSDPYSIVKCVTDYEPPPWHSSTRGTYPYLFSEAC